MPKVDKTKRNKSWQMLIISLKPELTQCYAPKFLSDRSRLIYFDMHHKGDKKRLKPSHQIWNFLWPPHVLSCPRIKHENVLRWKTFVCFAIMSERPRTDQSFDNNKFIQFIFVGEEEEAERNEKFYGWSWISGAAKKCHKASRLRMRETVSES